MNALEVTGIRKCFGGVVALADGNLVCQFGKITGLLGANGSGKSTISKIITGVYAADEGEVKYQGKTTKYRNPHEAKKDGIAMVFQNLSLIPDLTVWQNIVLGSEVNRGPFLNNEDAKKISSEIIEQLQPGLDIERKVSELNTGEMQIVEIAKAISSEPRMLILDEPTAALEQEQVKNLFKYMRLLKHQGVSMIFTSHRMWEVMEICDDVIIFRNGRNVGALDSNIEKMDPEKIISYITGENSDNRITRIKHEPSDETLLSVKDLNLGKALKDISFDLKKGEVLGIGGLAGQGQSELMLALSGNYPGLKAEVMLNNQKLNLTKPQTAIRNSMLLVPGDRQKEGLMLGHSLFTNMIFPKLALKKQPLFTPRKKYREECNDVIKSLSIKAHSVDTITGTLSGGNQQKVVVGKWLPFETQILLLADPAKGVDVGAKREMYDYILKQVREKQMSVILYASDSEELMEHCDRLMIMYEGQQVAMLSGDEINEDTIIATSMRVGTH